MPLLFDLVTARLFVAVAEHGSIAEAARHQNIAASAISKRLGELEKHFGVALFRRLPSGVELTEPGTSVLRRFRNLLQEAGALEEELRKGGSVVEGRIRLAATETAMIGFLSTILGEFLSDHPGVRIDLEERMSPDVTRSVQSQLVDIGIFVGGAKIEGLWVRPCFRDQIFLAVSREHPLTESSGVTLSELINHEIIGQDRRAGLQLIERQAALIGRQVVSRITVDGYDTACSLAANKLGVAVVAEASALLFAKSLDLVILPLLEPWARREHKVCVRAPESSLSLASRTLLTHIMRHCRR
jgi:DNA-binding transcriptional LysR family regulator